jgi:hypothetical protein
MSQYKTGTATVTNGSATVTGSGTLWLAYVTAGNSFTVAGDGVMYDVASVDSDTQVTLSVAYAGTTASGAVYAIGTGFTVPDSFPEMSQGDIETATIFTRGMRKIQSKFTGIETNTTNEIGQAVSDHEATNDHPLATTSAKGFLSGADKTKLDTVEDGATADQTKADIDALNIDADTLDGIDSLGFDAAGAADTAVSDHVALPDPHAQYAEIAGGAAANFTTMPQVGGDPVVESGSNADGEWTRWSDGTQSCHAKQKKTSSAVTTSLGSMYRSSTQTWTFPVAFSADTYGVSGVSLRGDGYSGGSILADPSWGVELTEFKYVLLSTVSSASLVRNVSTHAIGRWQ